MPDEKHPQQIHESLRFRPWPIGDYFVLMEPVMQELGEAQQRQAIGLYLQSVAASLQANLTFVEGLRGIIGGGQAKK